jgi:hypothetical protein
MNAEISSPQPALAGFCSNGGEIKRYSVRYTSLATLHYFPILL